jgi:hypothetical protein
MTKPVKAALLKCPGGCHAVLAEAWQSPLMTIEFYLLVL